MPMELARDIQNFVNTIASGEIEVYNEFSLQHELGVFLRRRLDSHRVQFERNISHFSLPKSSFEKKEIDIVVIPDSSIEPLCAIELKYPRNGQIPEQMYSFCKDITFLEQLKSSGFKSAYFLVLADDPLFYSGNPSGIYGLFRNGKTITGTIVKPTGAKDKMVHIEGKYTASWQPVSGSTRYCLISIDT